MASNNMIDPSIFDKLQAKLDQDSEVKDDIKNILQTLQRQGRITQAILSRAHSTPSDKLETVTKEAEASIKLQIEAVQHLANTASKYPYYKYNGLWSKDVQNTCFHILFTTWLGGFKKDGNDAPAGSEGRLLTLEELGELMKVPVNIKESDEFHLTIEEYLLALITMIDELARLAVNSVTLLDYSRPLQISQFIKDLHAGFQVLNLKNDILRKRSDAIKYDVKKVEDVVYDLTLRGLVPKKNEEPAS